MRLVSRQIQACLTVAALVCIGVASAFAQELGQMPPPPVLRPSSNSITITPTPSREEEHEIDEDSIVRVSTNLITVPAEVMDRNGRCIGSLQKRDFRIFEDGVEQELAYFAPVEQPFTVALLLDVSGSTQAQLQGDTHRR